MGLMFDLLYTKAPINFSKGGLILRCLTFSCTVAVLIGLVLQLISTGEDGEKWHKVDIIITGVLLVGALALEIYAIISLYLFSDWAMLWLMKKKRGKQLIQLRRIKSWLFFLPKQYQCKKMGQFDVIEYWVKKSTSVVESDQKVGRKILGLLLGIKRWVEDYKDKMLMKYAPKTAVIDRSLLFDLILDEGQRLTRPDTHPRRAVEENAFWKKIFSEPLESQISGLHIVTEVCYNLETEWDTPSHVASDPNNGDSSTVSQRHTMGPSGLLEENRELCRTLSRYMMYLLAMRSSLLPIAASSDKIWHEVDSHFSEIGDARDVVAACQYLLEFYFESLNLELIKSQQKEERWEMLKLMWVRILCYAATKGQTNEHLRELSQGGEFLTFLWFFLPQSRQL